MELLIGAGCVALVVLVVIAAVFAHRNEQRRIAAIADWAAAHGWQFVRRPAVDWHRRLPGRAKGGVAWSAHGTVAGRRVSVAEYSWTERRTSGMGKDESTTLVTHRYVVAVVHLDRPLGTLEIESRGSVSRLSRRMFGAGPVTGDAEFDRRFKVTGDLAVPPRLIAAYLTGGVPAAWALQDADVITWRDGTLTDPERLPGQADPALRVTHLLTGR